MKVYATPVVFICSHLSAGTKEGDELKRSGDYGEIVSKLSFPAPPTASSDGSSRRPATVADAFAAVWLGDLNYRLNLPDDLVRAALAAGDHARLITGDQLLAEQAAGRAFVGWTEAPITFPPTYKYRPGTSMYSGAVGPGEPGGGEPAPGGGDGVTAAGGGVPVNVKEEKKKRTPAWCDRVLWRGHDIRQLSYARAELVQSDHKPVMADFALTARELQPERLQEVLQNLRRRLDAAEMASQPRCTLENPQADLGELRYAEPKSASFRFLNTGDVVATWKFVPAMPGDPSLTPAWLSVVPVQGRLLPGEEVEICATACVRGGGGAGPAAITGASREVGGGGDDGGSESVARARVVGELADDMTGGGASSSEEVEAGGGGGRGGGGGAGAGETTTMAEAARRAAARAVGSGIATPVGSGGVSFNHVPSARAPVSPPTAPSSLAEIPSHPLDAIIVLHLDQGRDFFLTVTGTYIPSVFGQPLASLPPAAFPPDVPEPVGTLVDYLFDRGLSVPGLLQPPVHGRCSISGLGAVRAALDVGWGGAADLAGARGVDCHEAAGALLHLFGSLPRPLLASTPACCAGVDAAMAPWAAAAAAAARAGGPGVAWTLATHDVTQYLPAPAAADELLRTHLPPPERAACKHTTAFVHALLKAAPPPGGAPAASAAARILAQLVEVWFPRTDGKAAVKMGRLAFIGVLCGAHPGFLDGFNPMEKMYEPDGSGTGGSQSRGQSVGGASAGGVSDGNLIDF